MSGLRPNMSASLPLTGTVAACASRYTENSHGNCRNPPSSCTIDGTAVETTVWSRATSAVDSITAISTGPRSDRRPTSRRRTSVLSVWVTTRFSTDTPPDVPVGVSLGTGGASHSSHDDSEADPVRHRPRLPGPPGAGIVLRGAPRLPAHPGRARMGEDHAGRGGTRGVLPGRGGPRPAGVAGRPGGPADAGPPRHRRPGPGRGRGAGAGCGGEARGVPAAGRRTRLARPGGASVLPVRGRLRRGYGAAGCIGEGRSTSRGFANQFQAVVREREDHGFDLTEPSTAHRLTPGPLRPRPRHRPRTRMLGAPPTGTETCGRAGSAGLRPADAPGRQG